jgi:voltage-gated potassium channel
MATQPQKRKRSSLSKMLVFISNRMWLILSIYVISILVAADLFSILENKSFFEGLWWASVTALTIGYGDLSPVTEAGRALGIFFGHFWIFGVIPMIICNIISKVIEDKEKFTHAEQEWHETALRKIAAKLEIDMEEAPPDF